MSISAVPVPDTAWEAVCPLELIRPDTGVAALIRGRQIALVRVGSHAVYAVDNRDPFSGAMVISRGIVGDRAGAPTIASPIYKQAFDLRTGRCLDDASVALASWPARIVAGEIEIAVGAGAAS
ncbi:MAG: nitrite reductase small subunit NirD [Planctomycetes bacterium]|nr:nitrite reductase small subunit NirD [Planctomycetota bacterium]